MLGEERACHAAGPCPSLAHCVTLGKPVMSLCSVFPVIKCGEPCLPPPSQGDMRELGHREAASVALISLLTEVPRPQCCACHWPVQTESSFPCI